MGQAEIQKIEEQVRKFKLWGKALELLLGEDSYRSVKGLMEIKNFKDWRTSVRGPCMKSLSSFLRYKNKNWHNWANAMELSKEPETIKTIAKLIDKRRDEGRRESTNKQKKPPPKKTGTDR